MSLECKILQENQWGQGETSQGSRTGDTVREESEDQITKDRLGHQKRNLPQIVMWAHHRILKKGVAYFTSFKIIMCGQQTMRKKIINMRPVRGLIHWSREDDNSISCWRWETNLKIQSLKEEIREIIKRMKDKLVDNIGKVKRIKKKWIRAEVRYREVKRDYYSGNRV